MNKKLSDWASIAEIISGIAVVVTLIFLIAGIRENTAVMRASEYSDLMESLNNFQVAQMTDPDSVRVWDAYIFRRTDELSALDRQRLNLAVLTLFRTYESAYFSNAYGLMGDVEWDRFRVAICGHYPRVRNNFLQELLTGILSAEFWDYVIDSCSASAE